MRGYPRLACAYYFKKYKVMPSCIEVNPRELVGMGKIKYKGMIIRTNTYVVPGCLFVGVDD